MRPQHITAENAAFAVVRLRDRRASMRPQHITAENRLAIDGPLTISARASMRPQHITAENDLVEVRPAGVCEASMRPQHITAEN